MARNSAFPAFIQARYDPSGDGFPAFEKAAENSSRRAERAMGGLFATMAKGFSEIGSFSIDTAGIQRATSAAEQNARATRLIAEAAERAAAAGGKNSAALQLGAQQARAAAIEAEGHANALRQQGAVAEQLAIELQRAGGSVVAFNSQVRMLTTSAGQQRQAAMSMGQQFNDLSVQILSGQNAGIALAQQLSQMSFALAGFGGRLGTVGRFLGGPWGVALTIGATAVAALAPKLLEADDALEKVKFATDGLSTAQGLLGQAMDLATGKIKGQREELIGLAIAQSKVAEIQAQARADAARETIGDLADRRFKLRNIGKGVLTPTYIADPQLEQISRQVLAANNPSVDAAQRQKIISGALDQLEALQVQGVLTKNEFAEAAAAVASLGVEISNIRINQAVERLLTGKGTAADRSLLLKPGKTKSTAARDEFGRDAADRLENISQQFAEAPTQTERVRKALQDVDDLVDDIRRKKPLNMEALLEQAEQVRTAVEQGLTAPFDNYVKAQREAEQLQALRLAGLDAEAEAFQRILALQREQGQLGDAERAYILANARAMEARQRQAEELQRTTQTYLALVSGAQSAFERLAGSVASGRNPLKALGSFATDLVNSYVQTEIRNLSTQLFSGVEDSVRDSLRPQLQLDNATTKAAASVENFDRALINALAALTGASPGTPAGVVASFTGAADIPPAIDLKTLRGDLRAELSVLMSDTLGALGIGGPANDNGEITVTGQRELIEATNDQKVELVKAAATTNNVFTKIFNGVADNLSAMAEGTPFQGITDQLQKLLKDRGGELVGGALIGGAVGSLIFGGDKGAQLGASLGGSLGKAAGKELGKTALRSLGSFAGPLGGIAGGLVGGLVGGLFTKTKKGSATLGYDSATGSFTSSLTGNSGSYREAADNLGNSVTGSLQKIADALGGELGDFAVSIGVRKKKYVVDPTGSGRTKNTGLSFKDEADAIQAALADAIRDGAIQGIRAGTQRLLEQGTDLDAALGKAAKFEGVFKSLQQTLDPVGYAISELDRQFADLRRIFAAAGASSEEYAQLEQLYSLQRAEAIKQAASSMRSALQGLLDDLNTGEGGGLSLQTRLNNALSAYNPLAARVGAGTATQSEMTEFAEAAQTVRELAREMYGSQQGFFDIVDSMRSITENALGDQQALIDMATGAQTPFDATSPSSTATNDNAPVVAGLSSVEQAIERSMEKVNASVQEVIRAMRAQGGGTIIVQPDGAITARGNF